MCGCTMGVCVYACVVLKTSVWKRGPFGSSSLLFSLEPADECVAALRVLIRMHVWCKLEQVGIIDTIWKRDWGQVVQ